MLDHATSHPPVIRAGGIRIGDRHLFTAVAVTAIWVGATLSSIFAPDMVTGSQQDHLPIAVWVVLVQALLSTAFVLFGSALSRRVGIEARPFWIGFAAMTAVIWGAATILSIFAAPMVTGTDPTRIPIAAMLSPVFATIATAFMAIYTAGSGESPAQP